MQEIQFEIERVEIKPGKRKLTDKWKVVDEPIETLHCFPYDSWFVRLCKFIRKWCWCSWKHYKDRCYPEVWDRGLDGPWHCRKCDPCMPKALRKFLEVDYE